MRHRPRLGDTEDRARFGVSCLLNFFLPIVFMLSPTKEGKEGLCKSPKKSKNRFSNRPYGLQEAIFNRGNDFRHSPKALNLDRISSAVAEKL